MCFVYLGDLKVVRDADTKEFDTKEFQQKMGKVIIYV
jgi:hypothetical protein